MAQGLQTRSQAQHDHPQIAAESQQHLAHILGLNAGAQRRVVWPMGARFGRPRETLNMHQLVGLHGQLRQLRAKGLGDHLFGLVQMWAGINQVTRCLHGQRTPNVRQDGGHRIGMRQDIFSGVQGFTGNQGLGKSPGFGQGFGLFRNFRCGQDHRRQMRRVQTARCGHRACRVAGGGADHKT
jgi:hypothetical protein